MAVAQAELDGAQDRVECVRAAAERAGRVVARTASHGGGEAGHRPGGAG